MRVCIKYHWNCHWLSLSLGFTRLPPLPWPFLACLPLLAAPWPYGGACCRRRSAGVGTGAGGSFVLVEQVEEEEILNLRPCLPKTGFAVGDQGL